MFRLTLFFIPPTLLLMIIIPFSNATLSNLTACQPTERQALLQFKQHLVDVSDRLISWSADNQDCCKTWPGVVCDNVTGHVLELHLRHSNEMPEAAFSGKIDPSLVRLEKLNLLDLSGNQFGGIPLPDFLSFMKNLRVLNFSSAGFAGSITSADQLDNLSNLRHLDLQGNYIDVHSLDWVSSLTSLEILDLTSLDLSKVSNSWLDVIRKLPLLVELRLSNCQLVLVPDLTNHVNFSSSMSLLDLSYNNFSGQPSFPNWVLALKSLTYLNLANNQFSGPIPDGIQELILLETLDLSWNSFTSLKPSSLSSLTRLRLLNLASNKLEGDLSGAMRNMTSLVQLDLSSNGFQFIGGIPNYFRNFCSMKLLTLSDVKLRQEANQAFDVLSGCLANGLLSIRMDNCQLFGSLNISLSQFKNLDTLSFSKNSISGPFPKSFTDLASLRSLQIYNNKFNGTLPVGLGGLSNLESIDISDNLLEGDVSEIHFANLTNLWMFRASGNRLRLRVSPGWVPAPQLNDLGLGSWKLGPEFPPWLRSLKLLNSLNLSNTGMSSRIPPWFFSNSNFYSIDMSSNNLTGPLPFISPITSILDLSNNSLSGTISKFLCYKPDEDKWTQILNLGGNHFDGEIPDCWATWKYLEAVKLNSNKFRGNIPWSVGTSVFLESLNLRNNELSGEIPSSLNNCSKLVTLDFSGNKLVGTIPAWIGEKLRHLMILNLRGNNFQGRIQKELCMANSLRVLDLAENNLTGTIPRCVNNFTAMVRMNDSGGTILLSYNGTGPFFETALIMVKGKMYEYGSILKLVRSIDLSDNKLFGQIPEEMSSLGGLQSLNLSGNFLTGEIPRDIGSMKSLETMDLSLNRLSGEIPGSMSGMTFLSFLNLSRNKLRGRIPSSTQLQGFHSSSFAGNLNLCGLPLAKNCSRDIVGPGGDVENNSRPKEEESQDELIELGFYVSIATGFIVGFWGVVGSLGFCRRWRYGFFRVIDSMCYKFK
ncbi:Receptor-like protein EIX2 [Linum perenne]